MKPCAGIANLHANLDTGFFSSSNAGLLINNGHAYRTRKVSIRKKTTRKGILFTLHVASLGISNYVGRRAGLFLKCSTLMLCEVGESAEGNALL